VRRARLRPRERRILRELDSGPKSIADLATSLVVPGFEIKRLVASMIVRDLVRGVIDESERTLVEITPRGAKASRPR
jgi:hypothetical protein